MSDDLLCRIVVQLADIICSMEDQLHELRHMRQMLEQRIDGSPRPIVRRNPSTCKKADIRHIDGDGIHDLGMRRARQPEAEDKSE